jgi:hypothetical protein
MNIWRPHLDHMDEQVGTRNGSCFFTAEQLPTLQAQLGLCSEPAYVSNGVPKAWVAA